MMRCAASLPEESEKNLDQMIARLKERGIAVLLVGIAGASEHGRGLCGALQPDLPETCAKTWRCALSFFLDGVVLNAGLQLEDGMHPNSKGVDVMVEKDGAGYHATSWQRFLL